MGKHFQYIRKSIKGDRGLEGETVGKHDCDDEINSGKGDVTVNIHYDDGRVLVRCQGCGEERTEPEDKVA